MIGAVVLGGLALAVGFALPSGAEVTTSAVVVSLTFDDGHHDQYDNARPILRQYGVNGTFYINSGRVGNSGYMSVNELATIAREGDEIGGHTITHADLPTYPEDQQRREICDDRVRLTWLGFDVRNFAYPYGNASAATQRITVECGYNSARTVGGLAVPGACGGCARAEHIPPANLTRVRTPGSVRTDTTLAILKEVVTQAEQHGGGWVPLVIHHVCDSCGAPYNIAPSTLESFLAWMAPRVQHGTVVRTVAQVVRGERTAAVAGPVLPGPFPGSTVTNPSLEGGLPGVPGCFQRGGYGKNSYRWKHITGAHSGRNAEQVTITAFTNGDRKLITRQDSGTCAMPVRPGQRYRTSLWYKGSWSAGLKVKQAMYYRSAAGKWTYWFGGAVLPARSRWTEHTLTTPPVPAGATHVSFGVSLPGLGTLATDDFAMRVANS